MWFESRRFHDFELLGEGGQGSVYKALRRDRAAGLEQVVALKILHSKTAIALWRAEFESLSRVVSPYCVRVLSFERVRGRPALVLEFIDGVPLSRLGQGCLLTRQDVREIAAQCEAGLKDLHRQGIFHGDLSPQNILITRSGGVRLLDFGLANSSELRVTPEFAAPERLLGGAVSAATDIFSLGRIVEFLGGDFGVEYLAPEPEARQFLDLEPDSNRQIELGAKVATYMSRMRKIKNVRTRTQNVVRAQRPAQKLAFFVASFMLTISSATQMPKPSALATLNVQTRAWHYLSLNDHPVGYAPLTLALRPGQIAHLQWQTAHKRGQMDLTLKAGEVRRLDDRDFSQ